MFSRDMHSHQTRNASRGHLYVPKTNSVRFGDNSFKLKTIHAWNSLASEFPDNDFVSLPKKAFKNLLVSYFLSHYN